MAHDALVLNRPKANVYVARSNAIETSQAIFSQYSVFGLHIHQPADELETYSIRQRVCTDRDRV